MVRREEEARVGGEVGLGEALKLVVGAEQRWRWPTSDSGTGWGWCAGLWWEGFG